MADDSEHNRTVAGLEDRLRIQDIICGVTLHSDLDGPEQALALYAPGASIDYSALSGPEDLPSPQKCALRFLACAKSA